MKRRAACLALAGLLAAGPASANWTARGVFQYQKRLFNHLGFTGEIVNMPIRYAVVQVVDDSNDSLLATGSTDSTGQFVIPVQDKQVRGVRVRAMSLSATSSQYLLRVQDSPYNGGVYAVAGPVVPGHDPATDIAFNGGAPMVAPMFSVAEAFNILDCLENGVDYERSINGGIYPTRLLTANWSPTSTDGTYYSAWNIHLLAEDGFSDTVINHEEGHFMQAMFSHDDTPGGRHYIGDNNQDIRLSLSEGWATYFGLSVRRFKGFEEPIWYVDLMSESAAPGLNFSYELETPNVSAIGAASEVSVQHVLWHIAVPPAGMAPEPSSPHLGLPDSVAFSVFRDYFPRLPAGRVTTAETFWDGWQALGKGHEAELLGVLEHVSMEFQPDSQEDDDWAARTHVLSTDGVPVHHTFYPDGDADWVRFQADAGATYVLETTDETGDCATELQLFAPDTVASLAVNDSRAPGDLTSRIDFTAPASGTYYLKAVHAPAYGRYGSYDLRITRGAPSRASFSDITASAGVGDGANSRGVAWGDFDNDGYPDLYVCNTGPDVGMGALNQLFHNRGGGSFTDEAAARGVQAGSEEHEGAAWGDFDNDGNLDLVTVSVEGIHLFRNNGPPGYTFTDVTSASGLQAGASGRSVCWVDYDRDGYLDLFVTNYGAPNQLWHNNRDGTFGLMHMGLDRNGSTFSAAFSDFERTGRLGLALGLDGNVDSSSLKLYRQRPDGQFEDVTVQAGLSGFRGRVFGVAWADYDNDGWPDLAIANESGADALFHNRGDGTFQEVARSAGVQNGLGATSPAWLDIDNDGLLDLYKVNYREPATLFDNLSGRAFTASGIAAVTAPWRSVAAADFDRDGAMDLYLSSEAGNTLLRGQAPASNHWLELRLRGHASNRAAIGARAEAYVGGRRETQEVVGGQAWGSQPDQTLHFGLGGSGVVDSLVVYWPSGMRTSTSGVAGDRVITLEEGDTVSTRSRLPIVASLRPNVPNPFSRSTRIAFDLPAGSPRVRLAVYDVNGRLERTLVDGIRSPGTNLGVIWDGTANDGTQVASGVHFCLLTVGSRTTARKLLIVR